MTRNEVQMPVMGVVAMFEPYFSYNNYCTLGIRIPVYEQRKFKRCDEYCHSCDHICTIIHKVEIRKLT